jgi:hypothetical protein
LSGGEPRVANERLANFREKEQQVEVALPARS